MLRTHSGWDFASPAGRLELPLDVDPVLLFRVPAATSFRVRFRDILVRSGGWIHIVLRPLELPLDWSPSEVPFDLSNLPGFQPRPRPSAAVPEFPWETGCRVEKPRAWLEILPAGHEPGLSADEILTSRSADDAWITAELAYSRLLGTFVKFTRSE
jgi:hypothetical protein